MRAIPDRWYVAVQTVLSILAVLGLVLALGAGGDGRWLSLAVFGTALVLFVLASFRAQRRTINTLLPIVGSVALLIGLVVIRMEPERPTPWPYIGSLIDAAVGRRR